MPTIVVRNLPDRLHALLKVRAASNHRSMTKEVVNLIETGLAAIPERRPLPAPVSLRSGRIAGIDDIEAAIADGQK